jgi:RNA polymerase sigma-70 factor (ECF subfamily)
VSPGLQRTVEAGKRAWPMLALDESDFLAHVRRHVQDAGGADAAEAYLEQVHAADLYLACACAEGVPGAVDQLDAHVLSKLPALIARLRPSPSFLDDVRQALFERLLVPVPDRRPRIADYSGRGPLVAWVRVAAMRTALNLSRATRRDQARQASEDPAEVIAPGQDPELDYFKARYAGELKAAFEEALGALGAEDRLVLRLAGVEGLTGEAIAEVLRVDRSTIVRRLSRARERLYDETRRLVTERVRMSESEFASVARAVETEIEASLPRMLGPGVSGDSP